MADLNEQQFDPYDHRTWKPGDDLVEDDWEQVLPARGERPERRRTIEGRPFRYGGPGNQGFVQVHEPDDDSDQYHSLTTRSARVFKDGKVRFDKAGPAIRRRS